MSNLQGAFPLEQSWGDKSPKFNIMFAFKVKRSTLLDESTLCGLTLSEQGTLLSFN
jgi:hypothetical protein